MIMVYIQIIGCGFFFVSTIVLGIFLRKYPSEKARKTIIMFLHFIAVVTAGLPLLIGIFYPGLTSYDGILGIQSLPYKRLAGVLGVILLLIGFILFIVSNLVLQGVGDGRAAFFLTKNVVEVYVYKLTRNPMSLGFYLTCLALGLLAGSTYFTLWLIIEVIPSHVFYLKFFEERELELRFGKSYMNYRKMVPFMIPKFRTVTVHESIN